MLQYCRLYVLFRKILCAQRGQDCSKRGYLLSAVRVRRVECDPMPGFVVVSVYVALVLHILCGVPAVAGMGVGEGEG